MARGKSGLENVEAAYAYAKAKYASAPTPWEISLALPQQPAIPLPGQTIAQGAAAAKPAAGVGHGGGQGKHVASAQGAAHYKLPLGALIVPHGKHFPESHGKERFLKGAPGHWVHGWISQEKWLANQWKKHPHQPNLAHHGVQAGTHKWVQAGDKTVAAHHSVEVHVPNHVDTSNPAQVKAATKVLLHKGEKPEHTILQSELGLGQVQEHTPEAANSLKQGWKKLPEPAPRKSVAFEGKHAAHVPADWQVFKAQKPEGQITGKWAKDPQGKWHFIAKGGFIQPAGHGVDPETWQKKGVIVPDEPGESEHGLPEHHVAPASKEPGPESPKVDVGGVAVTKDEIHSAITHLNAAQSTNVKGPLKSKGHPLAAMDYMGVSKEELAKFPELKVTAGTKKKHVGQVKLAVLHHLQRKLEHLSKTEAEEQVVKELTAKVKADAEHAKKLTPAFRDWGGVQATKEQLQEAADWLQSTMGGKQSFKQAMNKTGNPLAGADYMGAAKTYLQAHPSAKGQSTKHLMLESLKELQAQATTEDTESGHDVAAWVDGQLNAPGVMNAMSTSWPESAEGAAAVALVLSAKHKVNYHAVLSPSSPGTYGVSQFPPQPGKAYMVATPDHKVTTVLADGTKHDYDEEHIAQIVGQWVNQPKKTEPAPAAAKPKPSETEHPGVTQVKKPEPQTPEEKTAWAGKMKQALETPAPAPKPEPAKNEHGVPSKLAKFLEGEPKNEHGIHYDTISNTIGQAFLHAKKAGHPVYVGQVEHAGEDAEHSWVYQFAKPSHGTHYMADVFTFGAEYGNAVIPSLTRYEDSQPGMSYAQEEIDQIVAGGKPPQTPAPKQPVSVSDMLDKIKALPQEKPKPSVPAPALKPTEGWATQHEWPQIHAAIKDAGTIPGNSEGTDKALARALFFSDHFQHDRYLVLTASGTWVAQSTEPSAGSYAASSSSGYYHVTPDHQIVQVDKEGNETALPAEAVLDIAKQLGSAAEEEKPKPTVPVSVNGKHLYDAPAGTTLWYDPEGGHPSTDPDAHVYLKSPMGGWSYVGGPHSTPVPSFNSDETLNAGVESGELKPYGTEAKKFAEAAEAKTASPPKPDPEAPPKDPGPTVPPDMEVTAKGNVIGKAPAGSKVYWYAPGKAPDENATKYVKYPDGSWHVYPSTGGGHHPHPEGYDHYVKDGSFTESGKKPAAETTPAPPLETPADQPKPDIPVVINGVSKGMVPHGTEFYKLSDNYGSEWTYLHKPDGTWYKTASSQKSVSKVYSDPQQQFEDKLKPSHPPTPEEIAKVEAVSKAKKALDNGAITKDTAGKSWQAAIVHVLASKTSGYWHSEYTVYQVNPGHYAMGYPPSGKEHWVVNPETLTATHVVPPSPNNETTVKTPVSFEDIHAAINEHLTPDAVNLGGNIHKHGFWYNPKGKAYLEVKGGGNGYHPEEKARYIWHQVNGSTKAVTSNFAATQLEKNTEYQELPKPLEPSQVAKAVQYASVAGPGNWKVYSSTEKSGVAPSHLTVYGDGSAVYHDPETGEAALPSADALLKGGAVLDDHGNTVVQPGVKPAAYHLFGSPPKHEAELNQLLEQLEKAGPGNWIKHMHEFLGTTSGFPGKEEMAKLFQGWWSAKGAATGTSQLEAMRALLRELTLIPQQKAAAPSEATFLKSLPEGVHSAKDVFSWTPNGWAKPFGGTLPANWVPAAASAELGDKIKAISAEFGNGKVVGTHVPSMTKVQKQDWLKAWKSGDMKAVFDIDAATGKVSPVHPGAPKNPDTHKVSWSPLDPAQVPASKDIEGTWSEQAVNWPKKEVNNYLIKMGFQHAEYLTDQQKQKVAKDHLTHNQDAVDGITATANNKFSVGSEPVTPPPTWTDGLKPAHSYDSFLEEQKAPYEWTYQAKNDFVKDHKAELLPFAEDIAAKHGWGSGTDVLEGGSYNEEVIQSWLDAVHSKYVAEQSVPVWAEVPTGSLPSHGHPVYKYTKTIPFTGEVSNWYVKPAPKTGQEWRLDQEHAANMVGRAFGFQTAHSEMVTLKGAQHQAQAEIKGKPLGHYTDMQPWSTFTPEAIADIASEHMLDWVVANDDSSPNNLIQRPDGRVIGIDKGRAWGNMKWPGLAGDKSMDTMTQLIYTKLYNAIRSHEISKEVADQVYTKVIQKARKMEAVKDARLRDIMEAGFASRPGKYGDPQELVNESLARKNSLEENFKQLWAKVYSDAGYSVQAAEDSHAEGSEWGPIHGKGAHGIVLFDKSGNVMLREPSNHFGNYAWTFSKGGSNPGETTLQAAIREVAEETHLKANAVLGYVPGGFGGTTSTSYFYYGLKDHTTDAPEMDNGETWNVKWVPYEEAKQLIAETGKLGNQSGMNRDLKLLDAAYEQFHASKANGFPVMETPAAGTGLPEIPQAKLGATHGGVPLHSGFSEPDFMDHVHASKSFGTAAFFGGPDLEYQHFIVWKEIAHKDKAEGETVIRGEGGARGAGLNNLVSWAKQHLTGAGIETPEDDTKTSYEGSEDMPGQAPNNSPNRGSWDTERNTYNRIIKAARTVSRHAVDKKFNAEVMADLDKVEQELKSTLEGMDAIDPDNEWVKAARPAVEQYLSHVTAIRTAKETGGTFKTGQLPRYLAPQKPKTEEKPKETGVKVTLQAPWRPATNDTTKANALNPEDGELHTGEGKAGFEISNGKVFHVVLPTGEEIDVYPGANHTEYGIPLAHYGHIKFKAVAADGSASLERIRDQLTEMGLPLDEATHEDMELYYWRHLYGVLGDRRDGPNGKSSSYTKGQGYGKVVDAVEQGLKDHGVKTGTELERAGLSPQDELAVWHKAWGTVTSPEQIEHFTENGGHLPHFQHFSLHDPNQVGGRPVWHRFDMDQKMVSGWKMPDHIFVTHPDKGAVRIIKSAGQYSKDFRFRHLGLNLNGQGNPPDTGATDFVFANLNSEKGHVIANPRILARTTNYGWNGDHWGRLHHRAEMAWFDPQKAAAWQGMETMFPGAWSLLDDIEAVRAYNSTQRQEMIDHLHKLGIYEIRGLPVEDRIGTDDNWSAVRKKIRSHWEAHPELLDPHYEPELVTGEGAQAAESGATAAKVAAPSKVSTGSDEGDEFANDPGNTVYTDPNIPGYHYIKQPDGNWVKVNAAGAVSHKSAGGTTAGLYESYVKDGGFQPVAKPAAKGAEPEAKPATKESLLADPANKVYTWNKPDKFHVLAPNGDWYQILPSGQVTKYNYGDPTGQDYDELLADGSFKPYTPPGSGPKTAQQLLDDSANQAFTSPSVVGVTYIKEPDGTWHVIPKGGASYASYPAGSHQAQGYDAMLSTHQLDELHMTQGTPVLDAIDKMTEGQKELFKLLTIGQA